VSNGGWLSGAIDIWGDGEQTRSFTYIDDCVNGTLRLMRSDCDVPEMVTINQVVYLICEVAGKRLVKRRIKGPLGVREQNSENALIRDKLRWEPSTPLRHGLATTYRWIEQQVRMLELQARGAPA